ncbi:MAG: putative addiction module antidote protein [Bdellovibrionaceae bacterium]|nr:putative addiction module antidote protein [Pseudobdellovibrionaceae bacterium]
MAKGTSFNEDLTAKLRDPEFASHYLMAAIVDNDLDFLPIALGDIAKAHGMSKLAETSGINRRTLYKVFDKDANPSFELVTQIMDHLGLSLEVKPKNKSKKKKAS